MDVESHQITSICSHCDRAVPSSNIDLHYAHCSNNLERCKLCDDMIPKKRAAEHFLSAHAPVSCSLCKETVQRESLAVHQVDQCPQRIVTCDFCEFPLPAIDLSEHQEVCGNRTELCHLCSKYVRLRERTHHETKCTVATDQNNMDHSRNGRAPERDHGPRQHEFSQRHLLHTIVIAGVAVLLGTFFLKRKTDQVP